MSADYDVIVIRAAVPLEVLRDTIRPFPSEIRRNREDSSQHVSTPA